MGDAADDLIEAIEYAYLMHLVGGCDQGCGWCEDAEQAAGFTEEVNFAELRLWYDMHVKEL